MPNFIEIGQTSLEIGGVNWASDKKIYFVTDGQKRDYSVLESRLAAVQEARLKMKHICISVIR